MYDENRKAFTRFGNKSYFSAFGEINLGGGGAVIKF
jgi:hypothetical protein